MKTTNSLFNLSVAMFLVLLIFSAVSAQSGSNEYSGFVRDVGNYCVPIATRPATTVTINTVDNSPLTGLTDCNNQPVTVNNNTATITTTNNRFFCFRGPKAGYDLTFEAGFGNPVPPSYRWVSETGRIRGQYSITEFGGDPTGQTDSTRALKSAAAYIGSQQYTGNEGGVLKIPNGFFVLTDSQNLLPVVLPPGMTIEGNNGKLNLASSRLQLAVDNKTVLKIGGCTNNVALRNVGLLSTVQSAANTRALVAEGAAPESSQNFIFSNISLQGFKTGIEVLGLDGSKGWQFDYVKLENSTIDSQSVGIHLDTFNSDWQISNTYIGVGVGGTALLIDRVAAMDITNLYGGGPPNTGTINPNNLAKAFIWFRGDTVGEYNNIGYHSNVNIQNSECENTQHSILYDVQTTIYEYLRPTLKLSHNIFGDPIKIRANVALVSIGNLFGANTVRTVRPNAPGETGTFPGSTKTRIYSFGDQFNYITFDLKQCPPFQSSPFPNETDPQKCVRDFIIDNADGGQNRLVTSTAQISSPNLLNCNPDTGTGCGDFSKFVTLYNRMEGTLQNSGNVLPSEDNQFDMGNNSKRWKLVRGVTVVSGDTILSDKVTGKELYKIHEDEENIFFSDIRNGNLLMRLDRKGNLYLAGKVVSGAKGAATIKEPRKPVNKRIRKTKK